ncbi:MAG: hypothetical protein ACYS47_17725 [Planctomycetota bacterium]
MDIRIGEVGKIAKGDYAGWEVAVHEGAGDRGGFAILISRDFSDPKAESYDDWVKEEAHLEKYFAVSSWVVEWTGVPYPPGSKPEQNRDA